VSVYNKDIHDESVIGANVIGTYSLHLNNTRSDHRKI